jgi:hypothetical protein
MCKTTSIAAVVADGQAEPQSGGVQVLHTHFGCDSDARLQEHAKEPTTVLGQGSFATGCGALGCKTDPDQMLTDSIQRGKTYAFNAPVRKAY